MTTAGATERAAAWGRAWLFVALALLAWAPAAVRAGFSFDDREAIEHNPYVEGSLPWAAALSRDAWEHRGAAGHYRPLAAASLRADRAWWGEQGVGFHATNVLLHALVVACAALLASRLAAGRGALPWFGLAIFAVHPALADSVAWISGRTSMLSAIPGLAAALWVLRLGRVGCLAVSAVGVALAMLGKEDGIVFAPLLIALAAARGREVALFTAGGAAMGVAAALTLRAHALDSAAIVATHAPLAGLDLLERLKVGGFGFIEALRLVAFPAGYPPNYAADPRFAKSAGEAPWTDPQALLGAAGICLFASLACGLAWRAASRRSLSAAGGAFACLAFAPFLQAIPAGEAFAPRFLYLPLLFAVPLLQSALDAVASERRRQGLGLLIVGVAVVAAIDRGRVYSSRAAYREAVLAHFPNDAGSWNDLGLAREEQGDPVGAREAWEHATRLAPGYSRAWSNLGRRALLEGRVDEAVDRLRRAVAVGPRNPVAWVNLGSAELAGGDASAAARAFDRAIELAPGIVAAHEGRVRALEALGMESEAREAEAELLRLDPGHRFAKRPPPIDRP